MTKLVRNPIDAHVGGQVKLRRAVVGMSQTELANRLGITFQQVQKYEKGANRIGASRLYLIAEILNVTVQSFFEGAEAVVVDAPGAYDGAKDETVKKYEEFIRSPGGIELCKAFVSIDDPTVRKRIVALVKSVSVVP
jgi:transcriptional regulator with XRE-family HTH domain